MKIGPFIQAGNAVRTVRYQAGLTQSELAKKAGLSQTTITSIERGHNITLEALTKIAKAVNKRLEIKFEKK